MTGMYDAAIDALSAMAKASGIRDEDADVCGPDETLFQIEKMRDLLANAYDNLHDMPINDAWATQWCERFDELFNAA